jgi:hypothetical protein
MWVLVVLLFFVVRYSEEIPMPYATAFFRRFSVALVLGALLSGCELTDEEKTALDDVLGNNSELPKEDSINEINKLCSEDIYYQPKAELTKKVDVLFVTDTSSSLDAERPDVAQEIRSFVNELPMDVDYQMAVMLAHGSKSTYSGKLYKASNEPLVLKSKQLTVDKIQSHLVNKLRNVKGDGGSDGGEEGLYSLQKSLKEDDLNNIRKQGFFRDDAALAIVFIADENDICARYPEGVKPVHDSNNSEGPAYARDCADVTHESVYKALKRAQGDRPLLISGIIYNEQSIIPRGGENEIGYGYSDLIRISNGVSIDLSGRRFHEGLSTIGSLVSKKLSLRTEFGLKRANIDRKSIVVKIDSVHATYNYIKESNEVHLTAYAGQELSEVNIFYCEMEPCGDPDDPDFHCPASTPSPTPVPSPTPLPTPIDNLDS